ncbi:unnamed protein product [Absidia cylindrospora]
MSHPYPHYNNQHHSTLNCSFSIAPSHYPVCYFPLFSLPPHSLFLTITSLFLIVNFFFFFFFTATSSPLSTTVLIRPTDVDLPSDHSHPNHTTLHILSRGRQSHFSTLNLSPFLTTLE